MSNQNLLKSFSYSGDKNYISYVLRLQDSKYKITEKRDNDYQVVYDIVRLHAYKENGFHFARCDRNFKCGITLNNKFVKEVKVKDFTDICKKLENLDKIQVFY